MVGLVFFDRVRRRNSLFCDVMWDKYSSEWLLMDYSLVTYKEITTAVYKKIVCFLVLSHVVFNLSFSWCLVFPFMTSHHQPVNLNKKCYLGLVFFLMDRGKGGRKEDGLSQLDSKGEVKASFDSWLSAHKDITGAALKRKVWHFSKYACLISHPELNDLCTCKVQM